MKTSTVAWIVGLLVVIGTLAACAGLDFGDVIQAETPIEIQKSDGLPSRLSVNDAAYAYDAWREDVQRADAKWRQSIDDGREVSSLLSGVALQQLETFGPALGGVPVAGPGLVGLSGVLAFVLGRGNLRREKEGSYAKGRKDVIEVATIAPTIGTRIES